MNGAPLDRSCALFLIDVQKGFLCGSWGKRNNPSAECKIRSLLRFFREHQLPIVHIHHLSKEEISPLRPGQEGVEAMPGCEPKLGERVFQKSVNSAFIGTGLETYLRYAGIQNLFVVGFSTDHCVSTSVRMGANLGFQIAVISDATVAFERKGSSGMLPADLVHEVSLASLRGEFSQVRLASELIEALPAFKSLTE